MYDCRHGKDNNIKKNKSNMQKKRKEECPTCESNLLF